MPSRAMPAGPLCWTISQRSVCRRKATGVSKSNLSPNFKSNIVTRLRPKKSVGFGTCGMSRSSKSVADLAKADEAALDRAGRAAVSARDCGHGFAAFELADQNLLFGCVPCFARLGRQFMRLFRRQAAPER